MLVAEKVLLLLVISMTFHCNWILHLQFVYRGLGIVYYQLNITIILRTQNFCLFSLLVYDIHCPRIIMKAGERNSLKNARKYYRDVIMSAMASQSTSLTIVYSTVYSGADQRKNQSSASLAFVRGIHRRRQWRGKCFHLITSSRGRIKFGSRDDLSLLILLWFS